MKLIKKYSPLSILRIVICKKMKRSFQGDLEVLGKLNHKSQVYFKSRQSGRSIKEQVINDKIKLAELEALAPLEASSRRDKTGGRAG